MTLNTAADKEVSKAYFYEKPKKRMFQRAPVLVQRGTTGSLPWPAAWSLQEPVRAPGAATNAWRNRLLRKLGGNFALGTDFYLDAGAPMVSGFEEKGGSWTTRVVFTTATSSSAATNAKKI